MNDLGKRGSSEYLGTQQEIDFERLEALADSFKAGASELALRVMDVEQDCLHEDARTQDVAAVDVLIFEGTWSNLIEKSDLRIYLSTNFQATLEHRRQRGRDPIDAFGEVVLGVEQEKLEQLKGSRAQIVVDDKGQLMRNEFIDAFSRRG